MGLQNPFENMYNAFSGKGAFWAGPKSGVLDPFNFFGDHNEEDGNPYGGMAPYPTYVGMEPDQTQISGQFMGANAPLDKFASESMRTGPSAGTQFALNQNRIGANASRAQAVAMAQGGAKNAAADLSMRGGLGAGANERIQKQAGNAALDLSNAADANASGNRANLMIADEAARTGNLAQAGNMVGQDRMQKYGMAAGDMARKQGEFDRRNQYNMGNYNTYMGAWGAGKQADATAKSGKK